MRRANRRRWSVRGATSASASRRKKTAAATRDRVEHLLAKSPAVIYSFKASGDYAPTFISRNVKDLLGYNPEDTSKVRISGELAVRPKDSERILGEYSRLFSDGQLSIEYRSRQEGWQLLLDQRRTAAAARCGGRSDRGGRCASSSTRHGAQATGRSSRRAGPDQDTCCRPRLPVIYSYKAMGDFARPTFVSQNIGTGSVTNRRNTWKMRISGEIHVHPDLAVVEAEAADLFKGPHRLSIDFSGGRLRVNDEQRLVRTRRANRSRWLARGET